MTDLKLQPIAPENDIIAWLEEHYVTNIIPGWDPVLLVRPDNAGKVLAALSTPTGMLITSRAAAMNGVMCGMKRFYWETPDSNHSGKLGEVHFREPLYGVSQASVMMPTANHSTEFQVKEDMKVGDLEEQTISINYFNTLPKNILIKSTIHGAVITLTAKVRLPIYGHRGQTAEFHLSGEEYPQMSKVAHVEQGSVWVTYRGQPLTWCGRVQVADQTFTAFSA